MTQLHSGAGCWPECPVPTLEPPRRQSSDQTLASTLALSGVALVPVVGGVLQPWVQLALEAGQRDLLQQFYEEIAESIQRHDERIGHVELDAFMARKEAAAAFNTALGLAAKTPSREKHRLLAEALVNSAIAGADLEPLLPQFWSMIERHSVIDVKLLHFLSDPVNLAIRAGYKFDKNPYLGECLFSALPELRYGELIHHDGYVNFIADDGLGADAEDGNYEPPDPTTPATPYFLFSQSMQRLNDDGLVEAMGHDNFDNFMESFEENELEFGDERPGSDGLYDGHPFESLTELGVRYLAFVSDGGASGDAKST